MLLSQSPRVGRVGREPDHKEGIQFNLINMVRCREFQTSLCPETK